MKSEPLLAGGRDLQVWVCGVEQLTGVSIPGEALELSLLQIATLITVKSLQTHNLMLGGTGIEKIGSLTHVATTDGANNENKELT